MCQLAFVHNQSNPGLVIVPQYTKHSTLIKEVGGLRNSFRWRQQICESPANGARERAQEWFGCTMTASMI